MQTKIKYRAVLIADVVGSTLTPRLRSLLAERVRVVSRLEAAAGLIRLPYAITAGDEIQALGSKPEIMPEVILDLRRRFRPLALRVGVGIGDVAGRLVGPVNRLTGEAFVSARRALDSVKHTKAHRFEALTAFCSPDPRFDAMINTLYGLLDTLIGSVSEKQWETINAYLGEGRADAAARALGINVSTVSRNLKRGYFWQMEETAATARKLLSERFD
ncbi:MAG TPA: SatD family protein [Terriglobia bacterium]|nr:SatD family protein [Terriglobia bacterium]